MLERLGRQSDDVSDKEMGQKLEKHLRDVKDWLSRQGNIDVIYVKYNDVVNNPLENARLVNRFLNNQLNTEKMAYVVEKSLHRQRKD